MWTWKPRRALLLAATLLPLGSCWTGEAQGDRPKPWSAEQQTRWYSATQGSRLMPLAWLKALEQADGATPFLADANIAGFRLLPRAGALPVGFAIDDNDDSDLDITKLRWFGGQGPKEQWAGLNCSACHTAELHYKGQAIRVDGGPSLFDYQSFVEAIDASLHATLASADAAAPDARAKWRRFSAAVLGAARDDDANRALLRAALAKLVGWEDRVEALNATQLRYGYGRVDAFGHIFNKVALFTRAATPTRNAATAPVSYPFLWDIYRQDKLQWNGIVPNQRISLGGGRYVDFGALGRNSGEVIGVFGEVAVTRDAGLTGYRSSIWADNLERLERELSTLPAPVWPADLFGAPGDTAAGKLVFDAHCASCHAPRPGTAPYEVTMVALTADNPNATDPWMACNAISFRSAPGNLEGTPEGYVGTNARYTAAPAPLASMLSTTVKGALVGKKGQIIAQTGRVFLGVGGWPRVVTEEAPDRRPLILDACFAANNPLMAYKARPLDGIWATPPYLHNGSVASLYELLLPPSRRLKSFPMGTREYDPVKGGYSVNPASPGNGFAFDTSLAGNSNMGHDYGVGALKEPERLALLAYLKSL